MIKIDHNELKCISDYWDDHIAHSNKFSESYRQWVKQQG